MSIRVNVHHVTVLSISEAMPKWKELSIRVHPDGYVCTLPEGQCNMPHRILTGTYKLKRQEWEK